MAYFADEADIKQVIGGFLEKFQKIDPLIKELSRNTPMQLKLELREPGFDAEIDLARKPTEIRIGSTAFGTVGMSGPADNFHLLLLGNLNIATAVNRKMLLIRGSLAKLIKVVPLFYVAPAIYPSYLESIGRKDLIIKGDRPILFVPAPSEDNMTKIISVIAYIAGYAIGFIKKHISPKLDIVTALESMGKGLMKATGKKEPTKNSN